MHIGARVYVNVCTIDRVDRTCPVTRAVDRICPVIDRVDRVAYGMIDRVRLIECSAHGVWLVATNPASSVRCSKVTCLIQRDMSD